MYNLTCKKLGKKSLDTLHIHLEMNFSKKCIIHNLNPPSFNQKISM